VPGANPSQFLQLAFLVLAAVLSMALASEIVDEINRPPLELKDQADIYLPEAERPNIVLPTEHAGTIAAQAEQPGGDGDRHKHGGRPPVMYCPMSRHNDKFDPRLTGFCTLKSGLSCKRPGKPTGRSKSKRCQHCTCKNRH